MPHEARGSGSRLAGDCLRGSAKLRVGCVVITLDRDFPQILALTAVTRPSVVLIRQQRLRAAELASLMASIWRDHENSLEQGSVLTVSARGTRTRRLQLA
jgi:predicted nuclease of predicted toxin-antitoxin system